MKEIVTEENLYASLIDELTIDSNPLDGAIKEAKKRESDASANLETVNTQIKEVEPKISGGVPTEPTFKTKSVMQYSLGITALAVVLMLIFSIVVSIIKIFANIPWKTWNWLLYTLIGGISISILLILITYFIDKIRKSKYTKKLSEYNENVDKAKRLNKQKSECEFTLRHRKEDLSSMFQKRYNTLGYALNHVVGLPFPLEKVDESNYDLLKGDYLSILEIKKHLLSSQSEADKAKLRAELAEKKIDFFYTKSMKYEITMPEVYSEFKRQYDEGKTNNKLLLRRDISVSNSRGGLELLEYAEYKDLIINKDSLAPIIKKFEAVAKRNTKGMFLIFTSSSKKAQQTKDMQFLVENAQNVYEKIKDINWHIAYALEYARACAYRNLYLGAELVNYIFDSAEGGTLTKKSDDTNVKSLDVDTSYIDELELNKSLFDGTLDQIEKMMSIIEKNELIKKLVIDNPHVTIIVGILMEIIKIAHNYLDNLNANAEAQAQLTNDLQKIADAYNEGKASLLRAIEITGSIVEANKGYATIYEPLSEKVYVKGIIDKEELKNDIVQLAYVINKYKIIADSKVK